MSFRKEVKLILNSNKSYDFREMLFKEGANILYPKRLISSLYFDNFQKQSYVDSIEGTLPRKKIRIRSYPSEKSKIYLFEKKISSPEGRYKTSEKISSQFVKKITKNGYFDKLYGLVSPIINVTYSREYFKIKNFRVTIDENIQYCLFKKTNIKKDRQFIVELKFSSTQNEDSIINFFTNKLTRFSKYSNGIDILNI
jgi:hypothetical protein